MLRLLPPVLFATGALAQGVWFVPSHPIVHIGAFDLPGWIAAAQQSRTGALVENEEMRAALDLAWLRYLDGQKRRLGLLAALADHDRKQLAFDERTELALYDLPWPAVHAFDFAVAWPASPEGASPQERMRQLSSPAITLALRSTAAGEAELAAAYDAFCTDLRTNVPNGSEVADDLGDVGEGGFVMRRGGTPIDREFMPFGEPEMADAWLARRPRLFLGGTGPTIAGSVVPAPTLPPTVAFGFDLVEYVNLITGIMGGDGPTEAFRITGLDNSSMLEWRWRFVDGDLQEDMEWAFDGEIRGILGALVRGMAPLPDQPLPAGALVQLRCGFDVRALIAAVDDILELADIRTLTEDELNEDIERAWTGGAALGVTQPRPGAVVPRIYGSFGIVDRDALDRLLARLAEQPWIDSKTREFEGVECTLLTLAGLPSALAPAYCVVDDTMHVAESPTSLRDLLRAKAGGAPRALDVGDAAAPVGPGTALPLFDLRFDGGAIHAALREVWLPLLSASMAFAAGEPLLFDDDLPEPEVLAELIGKGRGALRRTENGITLSCRSALGGPQTIAFLSTFFTHMAGAMFESEWTTDALANRVGAERLRTMHAAVETYRKREGELPEDLGTLIAAGDLDAATLLVPGDEHTEPVLHDGVQVATSSFRYYSEPLMFESNGDEVLARFVALSSGSWERLVMAPDGQLTKRWDEFGDGNIDALEKAAKEYAATKAAEGKGADHDHGK